MIAKFLGRKNTLTPTLTLTLTLTLKSFSLVGAPVDKENKKLLENVLVKNKDIKQLCLHSIGLQLPGIL